jgi:glycosyltransferase involved in cell wall biosynthesis
MGSPFSRPQGRLFFVSTYVPKNCGIATFTHDLVRSIREEDTNLSPLVVALNEGYESYTYGEEVTFEINGNRIHDYRLAADYINLSGAELVCLQHEFGIFGGEDGIYVTHLLENLKKPVVTTLHTILRRPTDSQRRIVCELSELSRGVISMSRKGIEFLKEIYGVPEKKIHFVPHGVPDVPFIDPNYYKDRFNVEGRLVLLTFGLLNPNKGIEVVLDALPALVKRYPKIAYIVLGATHPNVKRTHGEEYRLFLQRKVQRLALEDHVFFYNRFVTLEELLAFIGACDIYITPYLSKEQIVSGTLAYAVGMGKAVVSTPYYYAEELLADGRGRLFDFGDVEGLRRVLEELIENDVERHQMRKRAYELGRQMTWKNVARDYLAVFGEVLDFFRHEPVSISYPQLFPQDPYPEPKFDHLMRLTDDTGIFQHASYGIPDRRFGYSTDDVGRALAVVLKAYHALKEERLLRLAEVYLSFLRHAQREDGAFRNFMNYSRQFVDEKGSEDTQGRALWGLGCAVELGVTEPFRNLARELFERCVANLNLESVIARAYAMKGLYHFLEMYPGALPIRRLFQSYTQSLKEAFLSARREDWVWFTDEITYGAHIVPASLLLAHKVMGDEETRVFALEALDFLTEVTFNGEFFDFVGNAFWYKRGGTKAIYDQQPIDAAYATEAYAIAYDVTRINRYLELARIAFEWFFGRNRLALALYDFTTGACYDGLTSHGLNLNQGAESIICFLHANLTLSHIGLLRSLRGPTTHSQAR